MRDFIHRIATDRYLYAALILLDWPGFAAYCQHIMVPLSVESSPVYTGVGIILLALNGVVILAMLGEGVVSLVDYLRER